MGGRFRGVELGPSTWNTEGELIFSAGATLKLARQNITSSGISRRILREDAEAYGLHCLLRLEAASEMEVPGNDTNFYYEILGVDKDASDAEVKKA